MNWRPEWFCWLWLTACGAADPPDAEERETARHLGQERALVRVIDEATETERSRRKAAPVRQVRLGRERTHFSTARRKADGSLEVGCAIGATSGMPRTPSVPEEP